MKHLAWFPILLLLLCSSCIHKGQRDFRFESQKEYKLIDITCSSVPEDYVNPSKGTRAVYMIVFESEDIDVNGSNFKSRTYFVDPLLVKREAAYRDTPNKDIIRWLSVPARRIDNFVEETEAIIYTNNTVFVDTLAKHCQ